MHLKSAMESDVAEAESAPGDETGDGAEVEKPVESLRGTTRPETKIGQGTKEPGNNDSDVRNSILVRATKDLRQLSVSGHGYDHA